MKQLFQVALSRPFRFLFTESIIMFGALYNGYLYGLSFLFNGAFSLVFGPKGHGFDTIGVGLCFLGIAVGITFGPVTNLWQERYFQKRVAQNGGTAVPEARVQMAKVAAVGEFLLLSIQTAVNVLANEKKCFQFPYFGSHGRRTLPSIL